VNVADRMWARLMSSTNQPNFSRYKRVISQQRKQNAERQEEAENSKSSTNGTSKSVSPESHVGQLLPAFNIQTCELHVKGSATNSRTVSSGPITYYKYVLHLKF
jgi:hypothetical protein